MRIKTKFNTSTHYMTVKKGTYKNQQVLVRSWIYQDPGFNTHQREYGKFKFFISYFYQDYIFIFTFVVRVFPQVVVVSWVVPPPPWLPYAPDSVMYTQMWISNNAVTSAAELSN